MARRSGTASIARALGAVERSLGRPVERWSARSQQVARRNAMTACTALAARRLERVEVQEFVDAFLAPRSTATGSHAAVI